MSQIPKCQDTDCPLPATVVCIGPHGRTPYCEGHADWYETVMRHMGAPVEREAMMPAGILNAPQPTAEDRAIESLLDSADLVVAAPWKASQAALLGLVRELAAALRRARA